MVRSRVDEDQVWTGTYSAVDTKNPQNNSSTVYYGGSLEDSACETTSTFIRFTWSWTLPRDFFWDSMSILNMTQEWSRENQGSG